MITIRDYLIENYFNGKYHLTAGKLYCPECGARFAHVEAGASILPKSIHKFSPCPICGKEVEFEYAFSADFSHTEEVTTFSKALKAFFKRDSITVRKYIMHLFNIPHFIEEHSDEDMENGITRKAFWRKCICGENILLEQRRVK